MRATKTPRPCRQECVLSTPPIICWPGRSLKSESNFLRAGGVYLYPSFSAKTAAFRARSHRMQRHLGRACLNVFYRSLCGVAHTHATQRATAHTAERVAFFVSAPKMSPALFWFHFHFTKKRPTAVFVRICTCPARSRRVLLVSCRALQLRKI